MPPIARCRPATRAGRTAARAPTLARHPEQVRTLVAHEPPAVDIHQTYQRSGSGPAMAKFIALVSSLHYQHDCAALRAASTRVVLAAGAESGQQIAGRAAAAVTETLPKVLAG
jgi:hypothetical protein